MPLILQSSAAEKLEETWPKRRDELVEIFASQMYGTFPTSPYESGCELIEEGTTLGGLARRCQYRIKLETTAAKHEFDVLVFTPANANEPVPAFLGLSFYGNHTVAKDPEITLTPSWSRDSKDKGVKQNRATETGRGSSASRWPVELLVRNGYGLVTAYCGDIDPDFDDGFENGVHKLFPEHRPNEQHPDRWGTISAWAWGMSRMLDAMDSVQSIEQSEVIAIGHSRLGKTALWAGVADSRFAGAISNNSGCGGAALSKRAIGETVGRINTVFPHWFAGNFKAFNENEQALPFDQHQLIAAMAPRPVYVASASGDKWADPHGELIAAFEASKLYAKLGFEPLASSELPEPNSGFEGRVSYHLRDGRHDIQAWDWQRYIDFAKEQLVK
ncbi:MAG: acetylxylan esterase [Pirellulaceae bacterium]